MSDDQKTADDNPDTAGTPGSKSNALTAAKDNNNAASDKKDTQTSHTNNKDDKTAKTEKKKTAHRHKKRHIPWVAIFALILIIGLGAGNYWQYQQGQNLNLLVAQISTQQAGLKNQITDLDTDITEIQDQQKGLSAKTQDNELGQRTMRSTLEQMSEQVKSLATSKGKEPLYWQVSEVEYLLTVANHSLMLERDVLTAKTALQDADNRLRTIADPGLIPVREKISQEINQLNSVSLPDIPGMAAQLSGLIEHVNQLPFVKKELALETETNAEAEKEFTGVGNFVKTVWQDLVNGLFKVQRSDQPIEPLLPPEEKIYLVYNLELKLEQARIALLNRETALFRANLDDVEQWVESYFDRESAAVSNLIQTVAELKQMELRPQLPDISASLRELRSWLQNHGQKNVATGKDPEKSGYLARYAPKDDVL